MKSGSGRLKMTNAELCGAKRKENAVLTRRAFRFGGKIILGGEDLNIFGG